MGSLSVIEDIASPDSAGGHQALLAEAMRAVCMPLPDGPSNQGLTILLRRLGELLTVRCVVFGTIDRSRADRFTTRAAWLDGQPIVDTRIPDSAWPMAANAMWGCMTIPRRARQQFPENPLLAELAAECLIALPVRDVRGELLGGLLIIDGQPGKLTQACEIVAALFGQRMGQWLLEGHASHHLDEQASRLSGVVAAAQEAVRALSDSEERLRMALDAGAMGIWDWDLQSNEIIATAHHAAMFTDHPETTRGSYRILARRIHPEDRRPFERALWAAREARSLFQYEFRVLWPDGSVRWMSARGRYFFSAEGRAVRLLGLTADITEHKRSEEALRESESRFRGLFEAMTEGAAFNELVHDENGMVVDYRIVDANPAFERCTGIPHSATIGARASVLFGQGTPPFLETFRRVAMGGQATRFSAFIDSLGRHFDISAFSPGWGRFVTILEDSTEKLRLQAQEKQRQEELLRTAGVLTMGEMASAIAHELNQPLTAIAAYSEGCVQRWDGEERDREHLREILGEIRHEALRAAEILRSVRKFVQRHEFSAEPVALNAIIERVTHFAETQNQHSPVSVRLDLQPDLPKVLGDEVLLEIVLLNLIRNGLEAMRDTPPADCELRVVSRDDDHGKVTVSVIDRGPGVPEGAAEEIFGAYVTSKAHGMGLGLAISRSIIESHGGQLRVDRDKKGGAIFTFRLDPLPLHQGESS